MNKDQDARARSEKAIREHREKLKRTGQITESDKASREYARKEANERHRRLEAQRKRG